MKIFITGATGLIGSHLVPRLIEHHQITALTRNVSAAYNVLCSRVKMLRSLDTLEDLNDFDAVINLAGEPIAEKRWSNEQKREITQSRWQITERLAELFNASSSPPKVLISGSAIGYYGRQGANEVTEDHQDIHHEFSHEICARWEALALNAASDKTRVCLLRTGVVLAKKGGALARMLPAFRMGLGGPIASGEQYMAWIHLDDAVSAIRFLLDHPECQGPYNLTAPTPVTSTEFAQTLGRRLGRPAILRTPAFALRLLFGEMADLLIYGQRVIPKRLQDAGFQFEFSQLEPALHELIHR